MMIWGFVVCAVALAVLMMNRSVLMAVLYGVKGVTGGLVDMVGVLEESSASVDDLRKQTTRRIANFARISFPGYERFEAWTQCPSCDRIALHRMREPVGTSPDVMNAYIAERERWEKNTDSHTIMAFQNGGPYWVAPARGPAPVNPIEELAYDTIRICDCGQEWGQR